MSETDFEDEFGGPPTSQLGIGGPTQISSHRYVFDFVCGLSLLTADVIAIIAASVGTLYGNRIVRQFNTELGLPPINSALLWKLAPEQLIVGGLALTLVLFRGHYTKRQPFWTELREVLEISFFAILTTGFIEFTIHGSDSRQILAGTWILFAGTSMVARQIIKSLLAAAGLWQIKILVIGDNHQTADLCGLLKSERRLGYQVTGCVTDDQISSGQSSKYFIDLLGTHGADRIVLALDFGSKSSIQIIKDVVRERIPFSVISQVPSTPVFGFEQIGFFSHDAIMFSYRDNLAQPLAGSTKMAFDIIISSVLLILLVAPMAVIALLVKMDGGPALFAHKRVGVGGRVFPCLKFRTMCTNAEDVLQRLLAVDPHARAQWMQMRKLSNDPRITPIGRFLRATSLDELPQLFNVLRLEMSLVGPRPIVQQEIPRYHEDIAYYYRTKPGLTGLWQVSGRSETTYSRRVELDSWYVRNWSLWHDIAIILKTIPAVIRRQGAR